MTEDQLQAQCWQWACNTFPGVYGCLWHVPNGKKRSKVEAVQLQAMGVIPGVYDLHFYWKKKFYIIEMKVGDNDLSPAQKKWRDKMVEQGAENYACWTFDEFKKVFEGIMQRASLGYNDYV